MRVTCSRSRGNDMIDVFVVCDEARACDGRVSCFLSCVKKKQIVWKAFRIC